MSNNTSSAGFWIDPQTGEIHLPNGEIITSSLTRDEFSENPFGKSARVDAVNTGWFHCNTTCGFDSDKKLYADRCFCDQ